MYAWTDGLMAIVATLLLGTAATFYLRKIRLPREETAAGIAALAAMSWRDFVHLVLDAMGRRGYERIFDRDAVGNEGDFVLQREGQRWLMSTSKHGMAYVLGSTTIAEFANSIRLKSTAGGLLVTPGQFAAEAKPLALAQRIELLDGPTLWPELRSLLPEVQRNSIMAGAEERARRHVLLAWGGALVVGALLFVFGGRDAVDQSVTDSPTMTSTPGPAAGRPNAGQAPPVAAATAATASRTPEQRRNEVADAISTLSMVDRAIWSTQSTLLVHLLDERSDPMPSICPLLQRHQELRATRVQLQPPTDSTRTVRFVQCQMY